MHQQPFNEDSRLAAIALVRQFDTPEAWEKSRALMERRLAVVEVAPVERLVAALSLIRPYVKREDELAQVDGALAAARAAGFGKVE